MLPQVVVPESDRYAGLLIDAVRQSGFPCDVSMASRDATRGALVVMSGDPMDTGWEVSAAIATVAVTGRDGISTRQALESSAIGCVPWETLADDLPWTLRALAAGRTSDGSICFTLENHPDLLPLVVNRVCRKLEAWPFPDSIELVRVSVALSEALDNALYHGNLALSSELRQGDGSQWRDESLKRREQTPYRDRRIRFQGDFEPAHARFTIRDEGCGFDLAQQEDCTLSRNLERCSGRGLHLMHVYMDDVQYLGCGNEVQLVKRHPAASSS